MDYRVESLCMLPEKPGYALSSTGNITYPSTRDKQKDPAESFRKWERPTCGTGTEIT